MYFCVFFVVVVLVWWGVFFCLFGFLVCLVGLGWVFLFRSVTEDICWKLRGYWSMTAVFMTASDRDNSQLSDWFNCQEYHVYDLNTSICE